VIDWITSTQVSYLNISVAHPDPCINSKLMRFGEGLTADGFRQVVYLAQKEDTAVRLSCLLLNDGIHDMAGILDYLHFARSLGVSNVIFRQLMKTDPFHHADNFVVKYSNRARVSLESLLDEISSDDRFTFQRQIIGYYYYVEVWRFEEMNVVFEEADLAQLELTKSVTPAIVHELVFHPDGRLASTWQPWDGVLMQPT
jgi:hypothetical protein